jgi:hypothetical protein
MPLPRPPVYAVQFLANTFGYSVQGDWHFEPPTFTLSELRALQARVARSLARVRHSVPLAHIPAPRPLFAHSGRSGASGRFGRSGASTPPADDDYRV